MGNWPRFLPTGDVGLLVEFGDKIDPEIHETIRKTFTLLQKNPINGIIEIVPAYRSILIIYDSLKTSIDQLRTEIVSIENKLEEVSIVPPKTKEIPVVYGGEYGPDLDFVAKHSNLTPEEVIEIHTSGNYLVYMMGFLGFPLLGGLSKRLFTPRLKTPRSVVPARSVGIANDQTGFYTVESPGGWQLIGKTPINIYYPDQKDPFLIKVGDFLKFKRITETEYKEMLQKSGERTNHEYIRSYPARRSNNHSG